MLPPEPHSESRDSGKSRDTDKSGDSCKSRDCEKSGDSDKSGDQPRDRLQVEWEGQLWDLNRLKVGGLVKGLTFLLSVICDPLCPSRF